MKRMTIVIILNSVIILIWILGHKWISSSYSKWNNIDLNVFNIINKHFNIDFNQLTSHTEILAQRLNHLRYSLLRSNKRERLHTTSALSLNSTKDIWNQIKIINNVNIREWRKYISSLQLNYDLDIGMNYRNTYNDNTNPPYVNISYIFNKVLKYEDSIYLFFHLYLLLVNALNDKSNQMIINHCLKANTFSNTTQLFNNVIEDNTFDSIQNVLLNSTIPKINTNDKELNFLILLQFKSKLNEIQNHLNLDNNIISDIMGLNTLINFMLHQSWFTQSITIEDIVYFISLFSKVTNNINYLRTIQRSFIKIADTKRYKLYFLSFCVAIVIYYVNMFIFQNDVLGLKGENNRKRNNKVN